MAAAKKQPQGDDDADNGGSIVTPFLKEYADALEACRKAAQQTSTAQWQETYAAYTRQTREARESIAKTLRMLADRLDVTHLGEELEKELTSSKKGAEYLRERDTTWQSTTIAPLKEPVDRANALVENVIRQARLDEDRNPLIAKGLAARVRERVDRLARATWDDTAGTIEIRPGRGARDNAPNN